MLDSPIRINKELLIFSQTIDQIIIDHQFEDFTINVFTPRLDTIVSRICHCPRTESEKMIDKNYVYLNFIASDKKNLLVKPYDIISIRNQGRFYVHSITP